MRNAIDDAIIAADIEREHATLRKLLAALDAATHRCSDLQECHTCEPDLRAECARRLEACCEDLLIYANDHFRHEDQAMRRLECEQPSLRETFESHRAAHGDLMELLARTICANPPPAKWQRAIAGALESWLGEHLRTHDARLLDLLRGKPQSP